MEDRNKKIQNALRDYFIRSSNIVGNEANYQAILHKQLLARFGQGVFREYLDPRTGRGGIDVLVGDPEQGETTAAFEIKGGAYNVRNALQDTFGPDGYCSDMDKLVKLDPTSTSCWMVCVDAVELGRSMTRHKLQGAIEHARSRGLGFAYYAQGDESAIIMKPDGRILDIEIDKHDSNAARYSQIRSSIIRSKEIVEQIGNYRKEFLKEADVVGHLYGGLIDKGCSTAQISLETYFNFAPGEGMHQRPDLCIYEPPVDGHFNLYPGGDSSKSNDAIKLQNLRCLIEVKGGMPLRSKRDGTLVKTYMADIEKIGKWMRIIDQETSRLQIKSHTVDYVFLAIDVRKQPLSSSALEELGSATSSTGITLRYFHLPT